jgi:hypothetical protein
LREESGERQRLQEELDSSRVALKQVRDELEQLRAQALRTGKEG